MDSPNFFFAHVFQAGELGTHAQKQAFHKPAFWNQKK